jgi:hypothetical protein
MKLSARLQILVALASSAALLGYNLVLALRVLTSGPGHIGGDLIAGCYVLAAVGLGAASSLYRPSSGVGSAVRRWLLAFTVTVGVLWLVLHLGGFVFSHESMFRGAA